MSAQRLQCCVPFCKRTTSNEHSYQEWICPDHWKAVPKHYRRRDSKLVRRYKRRFGRNPFWEYKAGSPERIEAVRLTRVCEKSWAMCRRIAIEKAAGI